MVPVVDEVLVVVVGVRDGCKAGVGLFGRVPFGCSARPRKNTGS
jgi:hypothetical protein